MGLWPSKRLWKTGREIGTVLPAEFTSSLSWKRSTAETNSSNCQITRILHILGVRQEAHRKRPTFAGLGLKHTQNPMAMHNSRCFSFHQDQARSFPRAFEEPADRNCGEGSSKKPNPRLRHSRGTAGMAQKLGWTISSHHHYFDKSLAGQQFPVLWQNGIAFVLTFIFQPKASIVWPSFTHQTNHGMHGFHVQGLSTGHHPRVLQAASFPWGNQHFKTMIALKCEEAHYVQVAGLLPHVAQPSMILQNSWQKQHVHPLVAGR